MIRILLTGDFIFSSSFDKTARAWLFDVSELGEGNEERACIKTFKVIFEFQVSVDNTVSSGPPERRLPAGVHPRV